MNESYSQRVKYDKNLVAEQKGLKPFLILLFLAYIVGLFFQNFFDQNEIRNKLQESTRNIHPDFDFQIGASYISLSDGLLPEFALVVKDIQVKSKSPCVQFNKAIIEKLKLPIDFSKLVLGKLEIGILEISTLLIDDFHFNNSCNVLQNSDATAGMKKNENSPLNKSFETQASQTKTASGPDRYVKGFHLEKKTIPGLKIEKINLIGNSYPIDYAIINFLIKGNETAWTAAGRLQVNSSLRTIGAYTSMDFSFRKDEDKLVADIYGAIAEGKYKISGSSLFNKVQLNLDWQQIPLVKILSLSKDLNLNISEVTFKKNWLNGNLQIDHDLSKKNQTKLKLNKLQLMGDIGNIIVDQADFFLDEKNQIQFDSFDIKIKKLVLDEFFRALGKKIAFESINNFGSLQGVLHFENRDFFEFVGDLSGISFVFSSQGQRENQILSLVSGSVSYQDKLWSTVISNVKPNNGFFDGKVKIKADKQWSDIHIDAELNEVLLSEKVQKLVTSTGSLGSISGDVGISISESKVSAINGKINLKDLKYLGTSWQGLVAKLDYKTNEWSCLLSAKSLKVNKNDLLVKEPLILFEHIFKDQADIEFVSAKTMLSYDEPTGFSWKTNFPHKKGKLLSDGGWDLNSMLKGKIFFTSLKNQTNFNISGSREKPIFTRQ